MKITIHFEKGKSFWEYAIMGVMAEKQKKLGLPVNPFSHVAIYDGEYRYHTHPKKGVVREKFKRQEPNPNRMEIEIEVGDLTYALFWHLYDRHKGKPYNYFSILQLATGVFICGEPTNSNRMRFNCATWAAYLLNKPDWWKTDLVDLQIWIEKYNKG